MSLKFGLLSGLLMVEAAIALVTEAAPDGRETDAARRQRQNAGMTDTYGRFIEGLQTRRAATGRMVCARRDAWRERLCKRHLQHQVQQQVVLGGGKNAAPLLLSEATTLEPVEAAARGRRRVSSSAIR